jgi:hypothetical protein
MDITALITRDATCRMEMDNGTMDHEKVFKPVSNGMDIAI